VAGPMTGSATKQSRALWLKRLDCFASARNDEDTECGSMAADAPSTALLRGAG
jgi:hypothetical protein